MSLFLSPGIGHTFSCLESRSEVAATQILISGKLLVLRLIFYLGWNAIVALLTCEKSIGKRGDSHSLHLRNTLLSTIRLTCNCLVNGFAPSVIFQHQSVSFVAKQILGRYDPWAWFYKSKRRAEGKARRQKCKDSVSLKKNVAIWSQLDGQWRPRTLSCIFIGL